MKTLLTTASLLLLLTNVNAQKAGTLDTSFNKTGILTNTTFSGAANMILQSDGKVLFGGTTQTTSGNNVTTAFGTSRYNSNGSIDKTFGTNGVNAQFQAIADNTTGDGEGVSPHALCVLSTGKIIQGGEYVTSNSGIGHFQPEMGRYTTNGTLHKKCNFFSFMDVYSSFNLLKPQVDGSIFALTINSSHNAIITRLDTALNIDKTFSLPTTISNITDFTTQSDGYIIVAGKGFNLARYRSDLTTDLTFGTSGIVTSSLGNTAVSMTLQTDGKILLVGSSNNDITLLRFNKNGSLDNSFGVNGKVTTDFSTANDIGYKAAIQPNGNIIVLGSTNFNGHGQQPVLIRYNKSGVIDTSFSTGKVIITNYSIGTTDRR